MEKQIHGCDHVFDDGFALFKHAMYKDIWTLTRTCTRCGEALYPTRGTMTLMGIVDEFVYLLPAMMGLFLRRTYFVDLHFLAGLAIALAIFFAMHWILKALTRPILVAARWQPMEAWIRDVPREEILRNWHGKAFIRATVCVVILAVFTVLAMRCPCIFEKVK